MKRILLFLCLASTPALAQISAHLDKNVLHVGTESPRTELFFYDSEAEAVNGLTNGPAGSPDYLCLNGTWDFAYFADGRDIPADFKAIKNWSSIKVPGNWEVQGFGYPIYTNTTYEFCPINPVPGKLPEVIEAGVYHRKFNLPASWKDTPVYLTLAGASAGVSVYLNGWPIGYAEDSKDPARYDISEYVNDGENELHLKIFRWCTGSFLECQDFWRISGIERDVYLTAETTPQDFDISIISTFGPDLKDGILKVSPLGLPDNIPFKVKLLDAATGKVVFEKSAKLSDGPVEGIVANAKKWTAETPYLYTLVLKVADKYTAFDVGFRRFEMGKVKKDGKEYPVFLVNGQPVKFKGVNYHEHNPETGHYVTKDLILKDLLLMKQMNVNAIRTCHYPQSREFYELCDRLGFYVYDEANIETHGMGYNITRTLGNNPEWGPHHLDRLMAMYHRTANYPCVTILSLGNESGNGVNFYDCYRHLKAIESKRMNRPVVYERAGNEWNTDMLVPMYPGANWFQMIGETIPSRPGVPCEYAHAMGNSTGSLDLQWEQIYKYPNTQGGFIWDWVDQGLKEVDADGKVYFTYGGDYGKGLPSDGNFLCNGIVNPDRNPHPAAAEVKWNYQNVKVTKSDDGFRVLNRFYFIPLKGYTLGWALEEDGVRRCGGKIALSAGPQSAETVNPALPALREAVESRIKFEVTDPSGAVVAKDDILLREASRSYYSFFDYASGAKVYENEKVFTLTNGKAKLVFDKAAGIVTEYSYKGKSLIDKDFGLRPNFWRAPIDNDYGNGWPARTQIWKEASRIFKASAIAIVEESLEDDMLVSSVELLEVTYDLPGEGFLCVNYYLDEAGVLKVLANFFGRKIEYKNHKNRTENVELPRFGFRFRIHGADAFRYFGRGPEENYWDRFEGILPGVYTSSAAKECYPYVRPQETGHHTGVRWLDILKHLSVAGQNFEFNVLRCSVEDLDSEESDAPYMWHNFSSGEDHSVEAGRNIYRKHQHINDIPVRDYAEVCVDYKMSGVGGYDSWGARTEPERCLWSDQKYSFTFCIIPDNSPAYKKVKTHQF